MEQLGKRELAADLLKEETFPGGKCESTLEEVLYLPLQTQADSLRRRFHGMAGDKTCWCSTCSKYYANGKCGMCRLGNDQCLVYK